MWQGWQSMADYERHDWLAKRHEAAIDSDRPIIDPHHHLWGRPDSTYLVAELLADARAAHNITHTVFVECSAEYDPSATPELAPIGETRFVADQAAQMARLGGPVLAGIIGHADLSLGDAVGPVLEQHVGAGNGLFRGVRHGTNWSRHADVKNGHHGPTQGLLGDPSFRAGVRCLADHDLSFEAWMYFDQLGELAELARAVPECRIVLDHLGGPLGIGPYADDRPGMLELWRSGLTAVAACPNVVLKVGGLGMEHYFGTSWADRDRPPSSQEVADHWRDIVHFAIDAFGPARCMFESNFPVDRQTLPYTVLWNAFQILGAPYAPSEQDDLFADTARRTYRITD